MLFFSSLAFTVLENAMSVIFIHRVAIRRRHFLVSAVIQYVYILCLGVGLLLVTLVAGIYGMLLAIPLAACGKIAAKRMLLPRITDWARGRASDPLPLDQR